MISIISGGQTGADRAALDTAIKLGIKHAGWCPKGRKSEDGQISKKYNLKETFSSDYSIRTKLNILLSDATIIFLPKNYIFTSTDGTMLTIKFCESIGKAHFLYFLEVEDERERFFSWITRLNELFNLNIAGPRESIFPGIYGAVKKELYYLLKIMLGN